VVAGFAAVAAPIGLVLLVLLLSRGPAGAGHPALAASRPAAAAAKARDLPGLQTTPAPWPPEYRHLAARMSALGLPPLSDSVFHIHAELRIFVDGLPVPVPAFIGLPDTGTLFSPLHTHDDSGLIHMESTRPYPFTLGELFAVWGVAFTSTQLGGYRNGGGRTLQVYVNGKPVADPPGYIMHAHDTIIVGFGRPHSFPTNEPGDFSGGF
jgi:hypothetical protein